MSKEEETAWGQLSEEDKYIGKLVALGWDDTKIAEKLGRSIIWVKKIRQGIMKKLGCDSRIAFALYVVDHLPPKELEVWRRQAEGYRERIIAWGKTNRIAAELVRLFGDPASCEKNLRTLCTEMAPPRPKGSVTQFYAILFDLLDAHGNKIKLAVVLHLAPLPKP